MSVTGWINVIFELLCIFALLFMPVRWAIAKFRAPKMKQRFLAEVDAKVNARVRKAERLEQNIKEMSIIIGQFVQAVNAEDADEINVLGKIINQLQDEALEVYTNDDGR